jgi:hypothetical protein
MIQKLVRVYGIGFVLVGILGFFNDPVLGLFDVDTAHNLIHLGSGLAALILSGSEKSSRVYAWAFGLVYAAVAVIGITSATGSILGIFHTNTADNILHVVLAAPLLIAGFLV